MMETVKLLWNPSPKLTAIKDICDSFTTLNSFSAASQTLAAHRDKNLSCGFMLVPQKLCSSFTGRFTSPPTRQNKMFHTLGPERKIRDGSSSVVLANSSWKSICAVSALWLLSDLPRLLSPPLLLIDMKAAASGFQHSSVVAWRGETFWRLILWYLSTNWQRPLKACDS